MSTVHLILLYGADVWADALRVKWYRRNMTAVQRISALRVASLYWTVSELAALVIAGVILIDLIAQERKSVYERANDVSKCDSKRETRMTSMRNWQHR